MKSVYFLYGYFGAGNFGDDLLLYAAIRNILARDPDAKFLIRNYGSLNLGDDLTKRIICTDIEKIHWAERSSVSKFLNLLATYWNIMGRASTLVVGGGTLIHDAPSLASTFLLTCLCVIARIRGRKVIGIGLGAHTIKTFRGKILCRVLARQFDHLCLRDERSFQQFQSFLPTDPRVSLTTDLVYGLPHDKAFEDKDKIIAVTLVQYIFSRINPGMRSHAFETLAQALVESINSGYRVRLLSLQKARPDLNVAGDRLILETLLAAIPHQHHTHINVLELESTPESIAACYDGVDLMIGMRFHSLIFAALRHIPFIGLGDEPKVEAMCDEYSMPCLAMAQWGEESGINSLSEAIHRALDKTIDLQLLERYHDLALKNFEYFP